MAYTNLQIWRIQKRNRRQNKIKQNKTFWREQSVSIKKDAVSTSGFTQFCVDGRSSCKMKNKERKKYRNKKIKKGKGEKREIICGFKKLRFVWTSPYKPLYNGAISKTRFLNLIGHLYDDVFLPVRPGFIWLFFFLIVISTGNPSKVLITKTLICTKRAMPRAKWPTTKVQCK